MPGLSLASDCACTMAPGRLEPCVLVIFGASGDLTARKLMPALFSLAQQRALPRQLAILGAARTPMDDQVFRELILSALPKGDDQERRAFGERLFYLHVDYQDRASFTRLAARLAELDARLGTAGNRIFYLATPPGLYDPIGRNLGRGGLSAPPPGGFARMVVEKPFGRDLKSARRLDAALHQSFEERQIFRIDHYLAKETVQNILMLRFANSIFEPLWNRSHIEYVGIMAAEELGVEHRAGYYEGAGVVRDMFQNHLMQLLALTSMEPPSRLAADRVREEKNKVFRSLKPYGNRALGREMLLGQYGPGALRGQAMPGYREEPGVAPDSRTPTFAITRLFIDNWRWGGVPFYLASGKRLAAKQTQIVIQFREAPRSLFSGIMPDNFQANRLVIGIYPEERIALSFQAKGQGPRLCLTPVDMEFTYPQNGAGAADSYEKVLLDCLLGDQLLFWDQTGIELSWAFLDPVLKAQDRRTAASLPNLYPAGSWCPQAAGEWMRLIHA